MELLDGLSVVRTPHGYRLVHQFSKLSNSLDQLGQRALVILERLPNGIFDQPAFEINRFPGGGRQVHPDRVFEHPADFLKDFPGTFARGSRRFQLVEEILECLRKHRHAEYVRLNTYPGQVSSS